MDISKFRYYEKKPCKFILRSGKQVFGIVWEEKHSDGIKYFFSSAVEYMKSKFKTSTDLQNYAYPISLEEVVHAEFLR